MIAIRGLRPSENVAVQFRIRQVQNRRESRLILLVERFEGVVEEGLEHGVEFAHAAPAAPPEVAPEVLSWIGHESGAGARQEFSAAAPP